MCIVVLVATAALLQGLRHVLLESETIYDLTLCFELAATVMCSIFVTTAVHCFYNTEEFAAIFNYGSYFYESFQRKPFK